MKKNLLFILLLISVLHSYAAAYLPVAFVATTGNDKLARINSSLHPFLTIDAALDAIGLDSGIISIGPGHFKSPQRRKISSNTYFIGSGQPVVNSASSVDAMGLLATSSPTALETGTILNGMFWIPWNVSNISIRDLGVDVGLDWCRKYNDDKPSEALLFAQDISAGTSADRVHRLQDSLRTGIIVENVTTLCRDAAAPVHGIVFENCLDPYVNNIKTYFGFAGLVIKTVGGFYSNIEANGHSVHGIVLKDNDYSHCRDVSISNFTIRSIGDFDGDGFSISSGADPGSGNVVDCRISNGSVYRVKEGFHTMGPGIPSGIRVTNIKSAENSGDGFNCTLAGSSLSSFMSLKNAGAGVSFVNAATGRSELLNVSAINNVGNGINLIAGYPGTINFLNILSFYNKAFGLKAEGPQIKGIGADIRLNGNNNVDSMILKR